MGFMHNDKGHRIASTFVHWLAAACALYGIPAPAVLADFYDAFHDGTYCQDPNDPCSIDPNLWDVDNPHWSIHELLGAKFDADASGRELYLSVSGRVLPDAYVAASVDSGDGDPNTSPAIWNDALSHYIVGRVRYEPNYTDPNDNRGMAGLMLHTDTDAWHGYLLAYDLFRVPTKVGRITLISMGPVGWNRMLDAEVAHLDEPNGFWLAMQFESNGVAGDPNGKFLHAACWDGDKFDWNGLWQVSVNLGDANGLNEPPLIYTPAGRCGVMVWSHRIYGNGFPAEASFDDLEARTGTFTKTSHTLELSVKGQKYGSVTVDPDLIDANALRRYTAGTEIALLAEPAEGGTFAAWTVYDPNYPPGDASHAVKDTNAAIYLAMNGDYVVRARFACSHDNVLTPLSAVLLILGIVVAVRSRASSGPGAYGS
jgi:hypothetical protein